MMKLAFLVAVLLCVQLSQAGTLVLNGRAPWVLDPTACGNRVDVVIRQRYEFYLPFSQLCYVAYIDYQGGLLYIHQYKNFRGTFMAISKYPLNANQEISVFSFMRLGEGAQQPSQFFDPIVINPFVISIDLGYGSYWAPRWRSDEKPTWSEPWARQRYYPTVAAADLAAANCQGLDLMARRNYDHYLRGAGIIGQTQSAVGSYCYCMNTYVNRIGIWQVIGTYTPFGMEISTFVRLGDGYEPNQVEKCVPYPSFNSWSF